MKRLLNVWPKVNIPFCREDLVEDVDVAVQENTSAGASSGIWSAGEVSVVWNCESLQGARYSDVSAS